MVVTPSLEDYLEKMYFIYVRNGNVRVTDVANEMNISKPSVNRAIHHLKAHGLVTHEPYKQLCLTEKGMKMAASVANRHRILKRFLAEILLVSDEAAEDDACKIEHLISSETLLKLEDYINNNHPTN